MGGAADRQDEGHARGCGRRGVECLAGGQRPTPRGRARRAWRPSSSAHADARAGDQQAAHDGAQQVAEQFVEIERAVKQLGGLEQGLEPGRVERRHGLQARRAAGA